MHIFRANCLDSTIFALGFFIVVDSMVRSVVVSACLGMAGDGAGLISHPLLGGIVSSVDINPSGYFV